tara:strand:+ start:5995 stop:6198 length:204 start_codon:yes stop_codon:yes gene_type:complete
MKKKKEYIQFIIRIFVSLFIATLGLYSLIYSAKYLGAIYNITDGEYFITWALLSILVLLAINHSFKK